MSVDVVFETHSTSVDNEHGIATGWLEGSLSEAGKLQAESLGDRRRVDRLDAFSRRTCDGRRRLRRSRSPAVRSRSTATGVSASATTAQ
jgi:broad specificity phosphatase PhoE